MLFNVPPIKYPGDTVSSGEWNTYVRDNFPLGTPDLFTTKGDLAVGTGLRAASRFGVGTDGQYLLADNSQTNGMKWGAAVVQNLFTAKGQLMVGTGAKTVTPLTVGADGTFLVTDSNQVTGLKYINLNNTVCRWEQTADFIIPPGGYSNLRYDTEIFDPDNAAYSDASFWYYTVQTGKAGFYFISAGFKVSTVYSDVTTGNKWSFGVLINGTYFYELNGNERYDDVDGVGTGVNFEGAGSVVLYLLDGYTIQIAFEHFCDGNLYLGDDDYNWINIARLL